MTIKEIALEFARRKVKFHKYQNWKSIKNFGLFYWGDISKYLVGNPSKIKTFKEGLITTNMCKENKIVWCQPTEKFWRDYISPIVQSMEKFESV